MTKFTPRTTAPSKTDKNWIHTSNGGYNSCIEIDKKTGSCLPNCVGYAWGRWRELLSSKPKLSRGNAENWYNYNDGYKRGKTPKLGAVICWRKGKAGNSSDGAGHVAVVEKIYSDGSILTSNSNYNETRFYTKKYSASNNYKISSTYTFQGFIYPPIEYEDETLNSDFFGSKGYFSLGDTHENIGKIAEFMYKTFPAYTDKKALGNYYGKYIKASITEFQKRTKLEADGNVGKITLAELRKYGFKY